MRLTLFTIFLLLNLAVVSQNVVAFREAPLMGSAQYSLSGTAIIEELDNGSFQFRLSSNYLTQSGPDVQIFLTNNSTFVSPINTTGAMFVEDVGNSGGISHFSGALTRPLPMLTSLSQFDHVVFVCVSFGMLHWGNGSFGTITPVCTTSFASLTENECQSYTAPSGAVYTQSGMYNDTIQNGGGCDSIIALALTIDTINTSISTSGLTLTANDPIATYQWIDCNNNNAPLIGETSQSYTATTSGNYAVIVTNGTCSDTSACFSTTVTGIEEDAFGAAFTLYPNPAEANVFLELGNTPATQPATITVTNMMGSVVYQIQGSGASREELAIQDLQSGLYNVTIVRDQQQKVLRLVKQ